jgi:hypothetical protein
VIWTLFTICAVTALHGMTIISSQKSLSAWFASLMPLFLGLNGMVIAIVLRHWGF